MSGHWQKIIHDAEKRTEFFLATQITDERMRACGSTPSSWGIADPKPTLFAAAEAMACYLNSHSYLHCDSRIPVSYRRALEFAFRVLNPDGTFDYPYCNFRSAPDTAFIINRVFITRGLIVKFASDPAAAAVAMDGLLDRIDTLLETAGRGIMSGGFHTPNHRWACAAALSSCHRLMGNVEFKLAAEKYLIEGIDSNADGEYAERSSGGYNVVNNEQMITLAATRDDPRFLDYVEKNLTMMFHFIDPDGSIFTENSTRQDKGKRLWPENYYFHYLYMSHARGRPDFAAMASQIMDRVIESGQASPDQLDQIMLFLGGIDYGETRGTVPVVYSHLFGDSGLVRCRKGDFSYSLLRGHPTFFHFQSGKIRASFRLGVGFFERRDFIATELKQQGDEFVLELRAKGWYYLPFAEKPPTSDWWAMDNRSRERLSGPDLQFTIRVKDRLDGTGVDMRIQADGWDAVPLRLEIGVTAGIELESESFFAETRAGEAILAKSGTLELRDGLDVLSIGPAFAQHRNLGGTYGSDGRNANLFSVYCTALTPTDRVISLRRLDPRRITP